MSTSPGADSLRKSPLTAAPALLALAVAFPLLLGAGACTTSGAGAAMRRDIDELKVRLDAIDKRDA